MNGFSLLLLDILLSQAFLALPDVSSANLSLRAWTPTPAARVVHLPVSSPTTTAFPTLGPGRRLTTSIQRLPYGLVFEAAIILLCSGPQICSPPRSLLPQRLLGTGQPWLLRPRLSRFVASPSSGYANRPFRATDGKGTFTPQDSQPCRLLPQRPSSAAPAPELR
jgi:hypothetical protein